MKFCPTSPLSLARPPDASSSRGVSTAPQASTTCLARDAFDAAVGPPDENGRDRVVWPGFDPDHRRLSGRTVQRPVCSAAAMNVTSALPLSPIGQPLLQAPQ